MRNAIIAVICFFAGSAIALDSTNVLPQGINSPQVRRGFIRNIGERYSEDGSLQTLSDLRSIEFDLNTTLKFSPENSVKLDNLRGAINTLTGTQLGDNINLGFLRVDTRPEIDYWAPLYAFGVSKKWTVAIGVPIIQYRNEIRLSQFGSNVDDIQSAVPNGTNPTIDNAFQELRNTDLVGSTQQALIAKGYDPLQSREETFMGDLQIAGLYRFYEKGGFSALSRTTLVLPTGPKPDPDDLADLPLFGETAIEEMLVASQRLWSRIQINGLASVRLYLPDDVTERVPLDELDTLPDEAQKRDLRRALQPRYMVGTSGSLFLTQSFSVGAGIDYNYQNGASYSGAQGLRADLLPQAMDLEFWRTRAGLSYSSVQSYMQGGAALPIIVSYQFSDMIDGRNIERQTINELWVTMFF